MRIRKQADYAKNLAKLYFTHLGKSHFAKLDNKYEGPFEVIQVFPNDKFELQKLARIIVAKNIIRIWPASSPKTK